MRVMGILLRIGLVVCVLGVLYGGIAAPDGKAVTGCSQTVDLNPFFGDLPLAGVIGAANEKDCFTFTGAAGDRVRIRIVETSGTLGTVQTLFNPSSVATCGGQSKETELNCSVNVAGTWTITVADAAGNRTGNYRIAIQRLNNPVGCTTLTSGAAPTTGSISTAAEMDCYTFTTTSSSQVFRVRVAETDALPTLVARDDVIRPNGTTVCAPPTGIDLTCQLDATGTHTIVVSDDLGTHTGGYAIATRRLDSSSGCTLLTFGAAPASGTISAAAEMDCFRFTGAIGDRVRIRVGRTSGTLIPSGEFIRPDGTPFLSSEAFDSAGTYKIIVGDSFVGTRTGDYRISIQRLNNPVGCTAFTLNGAPVAGVVQPVEMDCYTFTGSVADRIQLHMLATGPNDPRFDLLRPDGTLVSDGGFLCTGNADSGGADVGCTLDTGGTHTIIVDGPNSATDYSLSAQRLNNPVGCTSMTFGGSPRTGSLAVGEMDCYTFTAAAGDQVRVRPFVTSGTLFLQAPVFGPDGGAVDCFPPFEATCPIDTTGTHTVLVLDDAGESGSYAVAIQRLNNPVGCAPLSFGAAPFIGSIAASAEIDCYTFSGASGDRIQVAVPVTSGSGGGTADVFDPNGELVCSLGPTPLPCALAAAGTYSILVQSGGPSTFDYAIAIQRLNNPPGPSCMGISFGAAPTTASIGAAGEMDCYTFSGAVGDQIRIRLVATSGNLFAANEVAQTDGTLVCGHVSALEVTCALDSAGQHRIIVSDGLFANRTGDYSIAVQRLNAPNNCIPLTFGAAPTSATIGVAAEMDCYTVSGTAGDRIRLHVTSSGALVKHGEVVRPNGTTQCSGLGSSSSDLTCRLDTTGSTRLLIDDTSGKLTGGYTLAVQRLNNPVGCVALTFGAAPTTGTIAAAGEVDCFTFSGAAGDRVEERPVKTSGTLTAVGELVRPNGTTVTGTACVPCSLDSSGTYTILVGDSAGTATGNYALAVQRLNNPVGCTPIVFGAAPTTGAVAAGEIECFTFAGIAGDRIHANLVQTSGTALTAQLFNPTGSQVCVFDPSSFSNPFACGLTAAGTHTLVVSGLVGGAGTGNYSLAVQRANNPVGCTALGFGAAPATGTIALSAEEDCFTFTGNVGDRIRFRPVETSGTLQFESTVLRPGGTVVCSNAPIFGSGDFTCALSASGTHTLVLGDSVGTRTGDYAVVIQRLNAPVGCTALPAPGTPAVGSIGAAGELDCFTVAATAGTTIPLDLAATSGTLVPSMEVVRTNGTTRCSTTAAHLNCVADTTGTYTVLVGDSFPRTRTGGYTLTRTS